MSYAAMVDDLAIVISNGDLLQFDAEDISAEGDYDLLNGSHKYVVVLDYFGMAGEPAEFGKAHWHDWEVLATLAVPYLNAQQAHVDMRDVREEILITVGKNVDLGIAGNLYRADVVRGEAIPDVIEAGGNTWQIETLTIRVRELAEYD